MPLNRVLANIEMRKARDIVADVLDKGVVAFEDRNNERVAAKINEALYAINTAMIIIENAE